MENKNDFSNLSTTTNKNRFHVTNVIKSVDTHVDFDHHVVKKDISHDEKYIFDDHVKTDNPVIEDKSFSPIVVFSKNDNNMTIPNDVSEEILIQAYVVSDVEEHVVPDLEETDVPYLGETDVEETDVEETDVEETDVEETDVEETDVEETDVEETDVLDLEEPIVEEPIVEEPIVEEPIVEEPVVEEPVVEEFVVEEPVVEEPVVEEPVVPVIKEPLVEAPLISNIEKPIAENTIQKLSNIDISTSESIVALDIENKNDPIKHKSLLSSKISPFYSYFQSTWNYFTKK